MYLIMCVRRVVVPRKCNDDGMRVAWGNRLPFVSQADNFDSLFVGVPFVSFTETAGTVAQQIRNCRCKRKRPPLVRGHHWSPASTYLKCGSE